MKRRTFITLVGGAAVGSPLAARAQQPAMPVIGLLIAGTPEAFAYLLAAFRRGLREAGFIEGQNVAIEYRWANNDNNQLSELLADLISRRVAVIVTPVGTTAALAAKAATPTIPIVFSAGTDPVLVGLVASIRRPGGNITGIHYMAAALGAKRLGLLHELRPGATRFSLLVNPNNAMAAEAVIKDVTAAAVAIGREIEVFPAGSYRDIDTAFRSLVEKRADALLVMADPLFLSRRVQLATLAARHVLPAIYPLREFPEALATVGTAPVLAAKAATATIPIVFNVAEDPVKLGLVTSLARPGGNLTGVNFFNNELAAKRLELLRELVPVATRVAVLVNPTGPNTESTLHDAETAARAKGLKIQVAKASTGREIDAAFATFLRERPDALYVGGDPFFNSRRVQLVHLATLHKVPAIYSQRQHPEIGGLMSYGTNVADAFRQVGVYTGRILKGAKPADLPVVQASKFELVINHQTARMLGLTVPDKLLVAADEVIE